MESLNPGGQRQGPHRPQHDRGRRARRTLKPGDTIVEPTSGNTGIGLAMVAAVKGYKLIVTMPEDMSLARRDLLARYGAQVVLTPAIEGMTGAVYAAQELIAKNKRLLHVPAVREPRQPGHPPPAPPRSRSSKRPTARSTPSWPASAPAARSPASARCCARSSATDVLIVAVEPTRSPVLQGGRAGVHAIQGIGASFVPGILNRDVYNEIIAVTDEDAIDMSRRLCKEEGLLVGISAGANVWASIKVAKRLGAGKRVVTVLCDTGERYLQMEA